MFSYSFLTNKVLMKKKSNNNNANIRERNVDDVPDNVERIIIYEIINVDIY